MDSLAFLLLCYLFALPLTSKSQSPTGGLLIDCGSSSQVSSNGLTWSADSQYVNTGKTMLLKGPYPDLVFSTLRFFPEKSSRKSCFVLPVVRGFRYLVRTAYFYGGFDGGTVPPIFDQIVDGTLWGTVDTAKDFSVNRTSFYELFIAPLGKTISVCVARNNKTASDPFISAIELVPLESWVYNSTDFGKHALTTVARHAFGYGGETIRFPHDQFDRFWDPFVDANLADNTTTNVSVSGFWNIPPSKVFEAALTSKEAEPFELRWPPIALQNANYYIALYFKHHQVPGSPDWRTFSVAVNNVEFYQNLNVTPGGVAVFATEWPLYNSTQIKLTPSGQSAVGPVINAGEVLQILNLGRRTLLLLWIR